MLDLKSAVEVNTEKDLERFAQGVLLKDDSVSNVVVEDNAVAVTFRQEARLFGFIGSTIGATISVSDDQKVEVTLPWYRFLFKISDDEKRVDLEQSVRAKVSAHARVENEFENRAQLLEILSAAIQEQASVSADVDAEANATSSESVSL